LKAQFSLRQFYFTPAFCTTGVYDGDASEAGKE